jgi:hypothetical protein
VHWYNCLSYRIKKIQTIPFIIPAFLSFCIKSIIQNKSIKWKFLNYFFLYVLLHFIASIKCQLTVSYRILCWKIVICDKKCWARLLTPSWHSPHPLSKQACYSSNIILLQKRIETVVICSVLVCMLSRRAHFSDCMSVCV